MEETTATEPQIELPPVPIVLDDEAVEQKTESVEESLTTIFRNDRGEMPDLSTLDRRKSSRWIFILVGLGLFIGALLAAAWAGFLLLKPFRGFQGQGLEITIDGPEHVSLGEETTYFINWKNSANEPLATSDIRVSFPSDFSQTSVDPQPNGDGLAWKIGSVAFGGRGTITVKGMFTGALGTKTAIQAVGTYRPASFNSDFETLSTRSLDYADTVLAGTIVLPQKVMPGDKIKIAYQILNRGLSPIKGLEARISIPAGFVRETTSTSGLDEGVVRLPVGDLIAGASTTVSIVGTFTSGHAGETNVHAETGRIGADGSFQASQKADATFMVLSGDLTVKLVANGSDQDRSVGFGDMMRFAVGFENTAAEPVNEVTITVRFDPITATGTAPLKKGAQPAFIDWAHADISASGTASGNMILWDRSRLGLLEKLSPQQDGTVDFSLPVIGTASGTTAVGFQAVVEATMKSVGGTVVNRTIKSTPITFRFRSDAGITSEARYFSEEGAPLGTGPLPPVVGQTTRYRIEWTIVKTTHELKNIRVTATLPKRVAWPAKTVLSAGDIAFDETSRVVTWTLNRLPADVNEARADLDIDLTPSDLDAGRFADLLGDTRFEAADADINEQIVKSKLPLTTDLQNDDGAKSKGVVRTP